MKDNKYIKILKKAKRIINNEDHYFICWAIVDSCDWRTEQKEGDELLEYITNALGDSATLGEWLASVANVPNYLRSYENLKAYRLRYCDHLMEVFK
jgi:hypothetical protein